MSDNDSDKINPWQRSPYWDRPDPDTLQYSDSPYAPDWAKRPVKAEPVPLLLPMLPQPHFQSGSSPVAVSQFQMRPSL